MLQADAFRASGPRLIAVVAAALVAAAIIAVLAASLILAAPPAAVGITGPSKHDPNAPAGVDLTCGKNQECGPGNPAVNPAPVTAPGPKVQP
ncbi:MAG: hypothetical protein WCK58_09530 [Chloroflexota bacterium]